MTEAPVQDLATLSTAKFVELLKEIKEKALGATAAADQEFCVSEAEYAAAANDYKLMGDVMDEAIRRLQIAPATTGTAGGFSSGTDCYPLKIVSESSRNRSNSIDPPVHGAKTTHHPAA